GTREELEDLLQLLGSSGLRPAIDRVLPLAEVAEGLAAMRSGDLAGKIVVTP
ncbi:MAG: zinc-binding dehydrogenase, partial [Actinobacteria bacterium]|nr:zinc-binding dehydrogenase [Actinomycetota bacterium]